MSLEGDKERDETLTEQKVNPKKKRRKTEIANSDNESEDAITKLEPKSKKKPRKTKIVYELEKFRDYQKIEKYGWRKKVHTRYYEFPDPKKTVTEDERILQQIILKYPDSDKHSEREIVSLKFKYKLLYYSLWFLMILLVIPDIIWVFLLIHYWSQDVTFAIKTLDVLMPILVIMQVSLSIALVIFIMLSFINYWPKKLQNRIRYISDRINGLYFSQLMVFIPLLGYDCGIIYGYRIGRRMELSNKCMESETWKLTQRKHNCCGDYNVSYWEYDYIPPSCCAESIQEGENCTTNWKPNGCLQPERGIVVYYLSIALVLLVFDLLVYLGAYFGRKILGRWRVKLLHLEVIRDYPLAPDYDDQT